MKLTEGKAKVNVTLNRDAWVLFIERCRAAGLNASAVMNVFVLAIVDPTPLEAMERFINVTKAIHQAIEAKLKRGAGNTINDKPKP